MSDTDNITCICGTSWQAWFELEQPEAFAKFHDESHSIWLENAIQNRINLITELFGLAEWQRPMIEDTVRKSLGR